MFRIAILTYDGLATFELACAIELFSAIDPGASSWYQYDVVSFDEGPLRATGEIAIQASYVQDLERYNMLVVPSWPIDSDTMSLALTASITKFALDKKRLVSFGSGVFLLAELSILNGHKATTHWQYADIFTTRFPKVEYVDNVRYVYEDNIGCSAGGTASIDLCIEIIRKDFGVDIAKRISRRLLTSAQQHNGSSPFVDKNLSRESPSLNETLSWATKHLHQNISVNDLATRARMSRRSFDRHFRETLELSPLEWLAQQKIILAKKLLEISDEPIEILATKAGYNNALALRHNFKKQLGISPSQYRKKFKLKHLAAASLNNAK